MNKIEFQEVYSKMSQLWPQWKDSEAEFGLFWSWFCDHEPKEIIDLLYAVAGENDFRPPRKEIKKKLSQLSHPEREKSFNWTLCHFVCVENGAVGRPRPGWMYSVYYPAIYDEGTLLRQMKLETQNVFCEKYGFDPARYDFFIGQENEQAARKRAKEFQAV